MDALQSASLPLERIDSNMSRKSQRTVAASTRALFQEPIVGTTTGLIMVWAGLSFGYYGFTMWMPEYFNRRFGHQEGMSGLMSPSIEHSAGSGLFPIAKHCKEWHGPHYVHGALQR